MATGDTPPLAKFAAAPFGIVEPNADAMLPVTLRHVQGDCAAAADGKPARAASASSASTATPTSCRGSRGCRIPRAERHAREAGLPQAEWFTVEDAVEREGRPIKRRVERFVGTREVSLLEAAPPT